MSLLPQQGTAEMHEFTAKTGKKVIAELLAVSDDKKMMKIRRDDGLEFESEIVGLSLDDQQYVKEWLKNPPAELETPSTAAADYRLELSLARKASGTDRHRMGSYTLEQKSYHYEVSVRNISRDDLKGARMEYAAVWKNAVDVYKNSLGEWDYSSRSSSNPAELAKIVGEAEIEDLAFNRDAELVTDPYELNRMMYSSEVYREDEFVGIIVRIVTADGTLIEEKRMGAPRIESIDWEKISKAEEEPLSD